MGAVVWRVRSALGSGRRLQLAGLANAQLPPEPYFPAVDPWPSTGIVFQAEAERLTDDPVAWFTTERVNLLAAVEQACRAGWLDLAWSLAVQQRAFQHLQDRHDDAERVWRTIADCAEKSVERGQITDAIPVFDRCIQASGTAGNHESLALALYWRSQIHALPNS